MLPTWPGHGVHCDVQRGAGDALPIRGAQALGALSSDAGMACIAAYSAALVDALPKHWAGSGSVAAGAAAAAAGASVAVQLEGKQRAHDALLACLADADALPALLHGPLWCVAHVSWWCMAPAGPLSTCRTVLEGHRASQLEGWQHAHELGRSGAAAWAALAT
jgi:hypothetical protein